MADLYNQILLIMKASAEISTPERWESYYNIYYRGYIVAFTSDIKGRLSEEEAGALLNELRKIGGEFIA